MDSLDSMVSKMLGQSLVQEQKNAQQSPIPEQTNPFAGYSEEPVDNAKTQQEALFEMINSLEIPEEYKESVFVNANQFMVNYQVGPEEAIQAALQALQS